MSDAALEERHKKLLALQDSPAKQASRRDSYAQHIIMQQDNRDALTAATEEKMAEDAAALAEVMRQRGAIRRKVEGVVCSNRYNSDGVYRNLPRVKAKLEVLKGLRSSFLNGETDDDQSGTDRNPPRREERGNRRLSA